MTEEFKIAVVNELRRNSLFSCLSEEKLLIMSQYLWELLPRIYNKAAND